MDAIGDWLDTGDKVASVTGAVIAVVALVLSITWQRGAADHTRRPALRPAAGPA